MGYLLSLLFLGTFIRASHSQHSVTQEPALTTSLGQNVRMSCSLGGGLTVSNNRVAFYQQKLGSIPTYLLYYFSESSKGKGPGVPDRYVGSGSGSVGYLSISNVQRDDDAVYYCATWTGSQWIFGPGTPLNVLTGKVEAPTLSIFPPSVEQLATDTVTYVCLMSDFTPKSFTVTWLVNGKAKSEGVETSQVSKQSNNLYLGSSYLSIRSADYNKNDEVACKVTHEGKDIVQTLTRSECV